MKAFLRYQGKRQAVTFRNIAKDFVWAIINAPSAMFAILLRHKIHVQKIQECLISRPVSAETQFCPAFYGSLIFLILYGEEI